MPEAEEKTPEAKPAELPAQILPDEGEKNTLEQTGVPQAEIVPPAPAVPEPLVGDLQLSILKDLEETNARENQLEIVESQNRDSWYIRVKGYYLGMPEAIKGLDDEFTRALENAKQEATAPVPDELKSNLENRMESLDLCLKMLKRLDRFYPRFGSLQEKVEGIPLPISYIWSQETDYRTMKLRDFPAEESRLKKDIEKTRDQNYSLLRQKKGAIEELKNFFFEFMQNYFFPIIDGLDKGKKFFGENQSGWIEKFADNALLIQSRFKLYDLLIDLFGGFLGKFNIEPIPVKEGDLFDERLHDPVIVETDEKGKTGQIFVQEVICQGYKFIEPASREEQVIRLPQIIVVKK
jgi:molecular chaperone GrpE (heat shock protein)